MNIVLTGFMATGKSEVGRLLAKQLKMRYIDTDEQIEKDVGYRITKIFKRKGEPYFRTVETKIVKLVSLLDNFVITTGGGVVLKKGNMDELRKNGAIICLTTSPEIIFKRAKKIKGVRPLLNVNDPLARIKELLRFREKYYRKADFTIDTSKLTVEKVVDNIVEYLKNYKP